MEKVVDKEAIKHWYFENVIWTRVTEHSYVLVCAQDEYSRVWPKLNTKNGS